MRVRIKICGITSPQLALAASEAGADAIGMMFYAPSSRHLSLNSGTAIAAAVPPLVSRVAVMVNPETRYVTEIIERVRPHILQFHGEEDASFCRRFGLPYIKAIRVMPDSDLNQQAKSYSDADAILLDTWVKGSHGGTGRSFDWDRVRYDGAKAVILAGGLKPDNVVAAISQAQPWAVDVSSGVEIDGHKEKTLMVDFCQRVAAYNHDKHT